MVADTQWARKVILWPGVQVSASRVETKEGEGGSKKEGDRATALGNGKTFISWVRIIRAPFSEVNEFELVKFLPWIPYGIQL